MGRKTYEKQSNFSGGEISPRLYGQNESPTYQTGLKQGTNIVLHPQNDFSKRQGSKYIGNVSNPALPPRLIPFQLDAQNTVVLELGDHYMRFWYKQALIQSGGTPVIITTPWSISQVQSVTYAQYINTMYFAQIGAAPQTLTLGASISSWTLAALSLATVPADNSLVFTTNIGYSSSGAPGISYQTGNYIGNGAISLTGTTLTLTTGAATFFTYTSKNIITYGGTSTTNIQQTYLGNTALNLSNSNYIGTVEVPYITTFQPGDVGSRIIAASSSGLSFSYTITAYTNSTTVTVSKNTGSNTLTTAAAQQWYLTANDSGTNNSGISLSAQSNQITISYHAASPSNGLFTQVSPAVGGNLGNGLSFDANIANSVVSSSNIRPGIQATITSTQPMFRAHCDGGSNLQGSGVGSYFLWAITGLSSLTQYYAVANSGDILTITQPGSGPGVGWYYGSIVQYISSTQVIVDLQIASSPLSDPTALANFIGGSNIVLNDTTWFAHVSPGSINTYPIINALPLPGATPAAPPVIGTNLQNCPAVVNIYQDRLMLAGSYAFPQTIWMSGTNAFTNFLPGANDSDPMEIDIGSDIPTQITWMKGQRQLLVGCINSEFSVTGGSDYSPITPSTVTVTPHSRYGGLPQTAIQLESEVLFTQASATKQIALEYSWFLSGYTGNELSLNAEHLFSEGIAESIYVLVPDYNIYSITYTGNILQGLYRAPIYATGQPPTIGFTQWETSGTYDHITSVRNGLNTEVWVVVTRTSGTFLEVFDPNDSLFGYLDCYTTYLGASTSTLTAIAPQLAGLEVVVAGTNILGTQYSDLGTFTVAADGTITLPTPVQAAIIGLPYTMTVETLPKDTPSAGQQSTLGQPTRWNRVFLQVYNSAVPQVNGYAPVVRETNTPPGVGTPMYTGLLEYGNQPSNSVIITDSSPFPVQINSIVGELESF